ncbi:MAG TPA: hypothetical protein VI547_04765 [Anaerolineales bacterium]|nr:hypothetical protein [Anaerolineales bacterium]
MTYPDDIQRELDWARQALVDDNKGRMRVCCRRAAGAAIRRWLRQQPAPPEWGRMAITQLRTIAEVESLPADVRRAAARLSTTVDHDHNLPFDESPIEDALIIIRNFSE